ncbi:unnamed protein product [Brachionus calyciflorus]|uniref:EF-hand domain-containing protein n=1 Tax=Brachionus calyciflorus TaxID=104777 RepID=A0A813SGC4_9BILA|nr:unnamed protein product [Brachionus calyciflorus]
MTSNSNVLSEEEISNILELFNYFDKDKNGFISKSELKTGYEKFGSKLKRKDLKLMVENFDVNKDGKISFEEFLELMKI